MSETATETDWRAAGCNRSCKTGHTFKWWTCGHAKEPRFKPDAMFRFTQVTADDGTVAWAFVPVPVTEYRLLDDPKPFLVFDGEDSAPDVFGTPWHAQLIEWTTSQGIDPKQVARIEVYDGEPPYAWVLLYDEDEGGRKTLVGDRFRVHAETVPLSSLPPLPEST